MKRTLTALAAAGFLALIAGPALAGGGCGSWSNQSVGVPDTSHDRVAEGDHSIPETTQTASSDEISE